MNEDIIPKIFISYSWTNDEFVVPLAERLREHGVDVVLDKWDLKEGDDKYAFMERCVSDPNITKVLIVCDKAYVDKANGRKGGVGDETSIISPEIYGNVSQDKFIPIVTELDDEEKPLLPAYVKRLIYIDFSDELSYEESYEKLLRAIYNKPSYRKPKLGKCPEWLDEEKISLFRVNDTIKQIAGAKSESRAGKLAKEFPKKYIETLKEYYDPEKTQGEQIFGVFSDMKDVRDVFLDYLEIVPSEGKTLGDMLSDFFEEAYVILTNKNTFIQDSSAWHENAFEIYRILLWELFICVTTFLLNKEDYLALNRLLTNTYFVMDRHSYVREAAVDYTIFYHYSRVIEEYYKPTTSNKNKLTLLGDYICTNRERKPLYSKTKLAEADLFLYQIFNALDLKNNDMEPRRDYWFPTLYIYLDPYSWTGIWSRLRSKRFALKICDLVGVTTIEELRGRIAKCETDINMKYNRAYEHAPAILSYIKPEEIGTLN